MIAGGQIKIFNNLYHLCVFIKMNKPVEVLLILLVLIAYKGVFTQLSMHDTLMLEDEKLAAILPEGTIYDIVISMTSNGEFYSKSFAISTLSESISSLKIPSEAKNKLIASLTLIESF
jgi:hypothetical protein